MMKAMQRGLLVAAVCFSCHFTARALTPDTKAPMTKDEISNLVERQPVVASSAVFDGEAFPSIEFLNKELITAALGSYSLNVRYFDAGWNEVQKPTSPGRYGAWVEIHFANGASDVRHVTLFRTAIPYNPVSDPYQFTVTYPAAFGLSKEVVSPEQWNTNGLMNTLVGVAAYQTDLGAVTVATMHDFAADPERWHGFNYWRIQESWWSGLEKKLGVPQDYQRVVSLPSDYDKEPDRHWPLILFLHGTFESGNDLTKLKDQGPLGYINQGHSLPFIVVTPQCPKMNSWSPERLIRLIDQIEISNRVDAKRIYVTGLSMGGFSTFDMAALYPKRIAAIAPMSAGENPDIVDRMKSVPAWIFHGEEDRIVSARQSIDIAERMRKAGAEVQLTIYPGVGHGGWDKTYADPALYAWLLQHSLK